MKAWTSLTDTSVVMTYREVPALKNKAFREFALPDSVVSQQVCLS
jgi:hypothetical protein